jgi:hypothetical protein
MHPLLFIMFIPETIPPVTGLFILFSSRCGWWCDPRLQVMSRYLYVALVFFDTGELTPLLRIVESVGIFHRFKSRCPA